MAEKKSDKVEKPKKVEAKAPASKVKKYKAIAIGFDGRRIIQAGEVFEYEGIPGKWMKEI